MSIPPGVRDFLYFEARTWLSNHRNFKPTELLNEIHQLLKEWKNEGTPKLSIEELKYFEKITKMSVKNIKFYMNELWNDDADTPVKEKRRVAVRVAVNPKFLEMSRKNSVPITSASSDGSNRQSPAIDYEAPSTSENMGGTENTANTRTSKIVISDTKRAEPTSTSVSMSMAPVSKSVLEFSEPSTECFPQSGSEENIGIKKKENQQPSTSIVSEQMPAEPASALTTIEMEKNSEKRKNTASIEPRTAETHEEEQKKENVIRKTDHHHTSEILAPTESTSQITVDEESSNEPSLNKNVRISLEAEGSGKPNAQAMPNIPFGPSIPIQPSPVQPSKDTVLVNLPKNSRKNNISVKVVNTDIPSPAVSLMQPENFARSTSHSNPLAATAALATNGINVPVPVPNPVNFLAQFLPNGSQTTQMGADRLPQQCNGNPACGIPPLHATPTSEPPPKRMKYDIASILGNHQEVDRRISAADNNFKNTPQKETKTQKERMYREIVENHVRCRNIRKNTPLERMFNDMKDELSQKSPDIRLTQKEVLFISIHTGARQCDIIQFFGGLKDEPIVIPEVIPQENRDRQTAMEKQFQKILDMNVSKCLPTNKINNPNSSIEHAQENKEEKKKSEDQEIQAKWSLMNKIFGPSHPQDQTRAPLRVPTNVKFADIGKSPVTTNASPNTPEGASALTLQTQMHKLDQLGTTLNTFSNQKSTAIISKSSPVTQKIQNQEPMEVKANESQKYPDSEASKELEMDEAASDSNDLQAMWNTTEMTEETFEIIGKPMTGEYVKSHQSVLEPAVDLKMSNSSESPVPSTSQNVSLQSSSPHMVNAPETSLFVPMKSEIPEKSSQSQVETFKIEVKPMPVELPGAEVVGSVGQSVQNSSEFKKVAKIAVESNDRQKATKPEEKAVIVTRLEAPQASSYNQNAPITSEKIGKPTKKHHVTQVMEKKVTDVNSIKKLKAKLESLTTFKKPEGNVSAIPRQTIPSTSSSNRNAPTTSESLARSTARVHMPIEDKQHFETNETAPGSSSLKRRKHEVESHHRYVKKQKLDALLQDCVKICRTVTEHVLTSKSEHVYDSVLEQYKLKVWEELMKQGLSTVFEPELFDPERLPPCEITQKPVKKGELPPCFTEDTIRIACPQCFQLSYTEPEVSQVHRNKVRDSHLNRE